MCWKAYHPVLCLFMSVGRYEDFSMENQWELVGNTIFYIVKSKRFRNIVKLCLLTLHTGLSLATTLITHVHCAGWWATGRSAYTGSIATWIMAGYCIVLYSTVLYCTVLYCTVGGARGHPPRGGAGRRHRRHHRHARLPHHTPQVIFVTTEASLFMWLLIFRTLIIVKYTIPKLPSNI